VIFPLPEHPCLFRTKKMVLLILLSLHPSLHLHRLQDVNLLGGPIPVTGSQWLWTTVFV